jgi:hypothetical protein
LQLAIAATDPNNIVAITDRGLADGGIARVTTDGGAAWQTVTGLPVGPFDVWYVGVSIAADPLAANTFYYHDAATGRLLRSTDKGVTFSEVNAAAPLPTSTARNILRGLPGASGDLWTCIDGQGLYRSTNAGASFTKIPTVTRAYTFAFGKSAPGSTVPALYLYGNVPGSTLGVFRSLDPGADMERAHRSRGDDGQQCRHHGGEVILYPNRNFRNTFLRAGETRLIPGPPL